MNIETYFIGMSILGLLLVIRLIIDYKSIPHYIMRYGKDGEDMEGNKIKILKLGFISFAMKLTNNSDISKDKLD